MFPVEGLYVSLENYECPISSLLPVFSFTVFVFGTEGVETLRIPVLLRPPLFVRQNRLGAARRRTKKAVVHQQCSEGREATLGPPQELEGGARSAPYF